MESTKRLFEKYDTDKNGFIDREEMRYILDDTYKGIGV